MSNLRGMRREDLAGDGPLKYPKSVFETIVIGDAYCGKTTYLSRVIQNEQNGNRPIRISDDKNEFEFVVSEMSQSKRGAVFKVKDTASKFKLSF
jgi:GTPase SAR1 family protein